MTASRRRKIRRRRRLIRKLKVTAIFASFIIITSCIVVFVGSLIIQHSGLIINASASETILPSSDISDKVIQTAETNLTKPKEVIIEATHITETTVTPTSTPLIIETPFPTETPTPEPTTSTTPEVCYSDAISTSSESDDFHIYDIELSSELQEYTNLICEEYSLDNTLLLSLMFVESNYVLNIVSANGEDYGLCQINVCNHESLAQNYGLTDMLYPESNIEAGAIILSEMFRYWNSVEGLTEEEIILASLNSYNMGLGGYKGYLSENGNSHYAWKYGLAVLRGYDMLKNENTISDDIRY